MMITVKELKEAIRESKKIGGCVYIGFSKNQVYVTPNPDTGDAFLRFNHVLYWFHPEEIMNQKINVRVHRPEDRKHGQYNFYSFDELVNDANNYEMKKSLT
jgi:hypothetical protein